MPLSACLQFAAASGTDIDKLRELYERALSTGALHFTQASPIRRAADRALPLHPAQLLLLRHTDKYSSPRSSPFLLSQGGSLWHAFRAFEVQQLAELDPSAPPAAREKAAARIRALFRRQLAVPLLGAEATLEALSAWESSQGSSVPPEVLAAHAKALQMARVRAPVEENIASARNPAPPRPVSALVF